MTSMNSGSIGSVEKKNQLFIKGKCFNDCEAALTVGSENTQFYVCMDELAKLSDYFRVMFYGDFKEKKQKQFNITDETTNDMICFFNAINPDSNVRKITSDSIELLMRLADKYQCDRLKERLKNHIKANFKSNSPATILNWFIWSLQYHMPDEIVKICLPGVACVSMTTLRANRHKIESGLYAKLLDAKMEFMFKAVDLGKKKKITYSCDTCKAKNRLPYKIQWCAENEHVTHTLCSSCLQEGRSFKKCCEKGDYFYKCCSCQLDTSAYKNQDQCSCARKNYEILLKEMS